MKKMNSLYYRMGSVLTSVLSLVLFVGANTTSCHLVHQPEAPKGLDRFSVIK